MYTLLYSLNGVGDMAPPARVPQVKFRRPEVWLRRPEVFVRHPQLKAASPPTFDLNVIEVLNVLL